MSKLRVNRLDEDGEWDDRRTGNLSLPHLEQSEEPSLYVTDENGDTRLLTHRITAETSYTKQEGKTNLNVNSEFRKLPNVNLCTLPQILEIVERGITDQMPLTELLLKDVDFFQNLMAVFETCETSKNLDDLHMMFKIVKGIIVLNSSQILEIILGDQLIMKIVGCLEYNPDDPQSQDSQHHRNYLRDHVVFKEAIPIKDPLVLSKIHQTFRIGFLKDNVLHNVLDEDTSAKLELAMDANIVSIITLLQNDSNIIQELFERLRSPSTSVESRNSLVDFLHEFCRLCKRLELSLKLHIFRKLTKEGIFDIIADDLQSPDKKLVLTGIDILSSLLDQDPTLLRSYVLPPETPILDFLVKGMMEDFGEKMQCQFVDLIQEILECGGYQQQARVMEILCEKHIPVLVDFITASCPRNPVNSSEDAVIRVGSHCGTTPEVMLRICEFLCSCVPIPVSSPGNPVNSSEDAAIRVGSHCGATPEVLLRICEFLCFCVRLVTSRKNFLLKDVTLTLRKDVVAAVTGCLRTLLSPGDDNVHRYIVEKNMLKQIRDVFVVDDHGDNQLNSAILELLQHICKGRPTVLLKYVLEEFWDQLAPVEDLASIMAKYEQSTGEPVDEPALDEVKGYGDLVDAQLPSEEQVKKKIAAKGKEIAHDSYVAASSSTSPRSGGGLVDAQLSSAEQVEKNIADQRKKKAERTKKKAYEKKSIADPVDEPALDEENAAYSTQEETKKRIERMKEKWTKQEAIKKEEKKVKDKATKIARNNKSIRDCVKQNLNRVKNCGFK